MMDEASLRFCVDEGEGIAKFWRDKWYYSLLPPHKNWSLPYLSHGCGDGAMVRSGVDPIEIRQTMEVWQ
jgi:hypothetical protein